MEQTSKYFCQCYYCQHSGDDVMPGVWRLLYQHWGDDVVLGVWRLLCQHSVIKLCQVFGGYFVSIRWWCHARDLEATLSALGWWCYVRDSEVTLSAMSGGVMTWGLEVTLSALEWWCYARGWRLLYQHCGDDVMLGIRRLLCQQWVMMLCQGLEVTLSALEWWCYARGLEATLSALGWWCYVRGLEVILLAVQFDYMTRGGGYFHYKSEA